jgi:hypothetical protein
MPSVPALPATDDVPPFGIGDWVVTGNETFADGVLLLDGNLTVAPGGRLTISNSSLIIFCRYPAEHEIRVRPGGSLGIVNHSLLSSLGEWSTFGFRIEVGAQAELTNSTFITCGLRLAGIIIDSDAVSIDNCTFTNSFTALTLRTDAKVVSSIFSLNYYAACSGSGQVEFSDCRFEGNSWATFPSGSTADFVNCDFINNSLGVSCENSRCQFRDCRFLRNIAVAIYVWSEPSSPGPSDIYLEDCKFEGNTIGIRNFPETVENHLDVVNCDFLNNSKFGIQWENRGTRPSGNLTHWVASKDCLAVNSDFELDGNVMIESGGNLTCSGSDIKFDSAFPGENGITAEPGGRLALEDGASIRAIDTNQYRIHCGPGSAFEMENSLLRDCGWDLSSWETKGPLFDGASVRIISSTIDFCPASILLRNLLDADIRDSVLRGLSTGVEMENATATSWNSSLNPVAGPSAWLANGSALECVNSTIDRNIVRFDDNASRLNLSWYLDVRARWADGSPADGALVSVSDRSGSEVAREELGTDGRLRGLVLRESTLGLDSSFNFTPHTVNCSFGAVHNRSVQIMDRSRSLDIVLDDRDAPSVVIAFPGPDAFLSSGTVVVNGTASDNLAVEKVELVVDGFRRLTPQWPGGPFQAVVYWDATLVLPEGPHTVEAHAYDRAGNIAYGSVAFTVDWSAPRIRVASPPDGYLTNRSLVAVSGFMEPGARVLLGGYEVKTERDTFGGTVVLGEGDNLVTATALDRAGNANLSSVHVRLDTRPPALDVLWPPDGLRTGAPVVTVNGTMEPGAGVTVNGRPVALTGEPGTFRTAIALSGESNRIAVEATDAAGNRNLTVRTVTLDTLPPALEIESPPEGLLANRSDLWLTAVIEGGAMLSVDGCWTRAPGGPDAPTSVSVPLALTEGTNTIVITAVDEAGNLNYTTRHVVVDTQPPALSISSPGDGLRTGQRSVFIIGETEPGSTVTVNAQPVPVGRTGSFSLEVRLASGLNRFTISAVDAAGNTNRTAFGIQRIAAAGDEILPGPVGPDWPFWGFVALAAGVCLSEWAVASRYIGNRRGA